MKIPAVASSKTFTGGRLRAAAPQPLLHGSDCRYRNEPPIFVLFAANALTFFAAGGFANHANPIFWAMQASRRYVYEFRRTVQSEIQLRFEKHENKPKDNRPNY